MILFRLLISYQFELMLACLDAWEFAPARPRLEPEVDPVERGRRPQAIRHARVTSEPRTRGQSLRLGAAF